MYTVVYLHKSSSEKQRELKEGRHFGQRKRIVGLCVIIKLAAKVKIQCSYFLLILKVKNIKI